MIATSLETELEILKLQHRYRSLKSLTEKKGVEVILDGRKLLNFASNNYLGLTNHPLVQQASIRAIQEYGTGGESSRLLSGTCELHTTLEKAIAKLKGTESALVFPSGYMAALGAIPTLIGPKDLILHDRLNHASLVEASFLSGAKLWTYPHKDVQRLTELLVRSQENAFQHRWVVTESLFSMDGDIAPLPEILDLCKTYNACLMIDEAHATGILGRTGQGALEHFSIPSREVDIVMGTLSKALASQGGFIAGTHLVVDYLCNKAKSFIYTTSLAPSSVAAAWKAIQVLENEGIHLEKLRDNIQFFRKGLKALGWRSGRDQTPIFPIVMGGDEETLEAASCLLGQGIFAPAIRPPTVPKGKGRIRFSIRADHTVEHLDQALEALRKLKIKNQESK